MESFLLLAKSARGAACSQLINDCISAPGIFTFGELLDLKSIDQQRDTEHYRKLQLFAYGTIADSKNLTLTPKQYFKLKQLTFVSLCLNSSILGYDQLLLHLELSNVRELEDLIMDCIYQNIVKGKLDQKNKCFICEYAISRDLKDGDLDSILYTLSCWENHTARIIDFIEGSVSSLNELAVQKENEKKEFKSKVDGMKKQVDNDSRYCKPHHRSRA